MIPNRPNLYLAGPLFSTGERRWNNSLRDLLDEVCNVYLPQDDGHLLVDLVADGMPVARAKELIFSCDIQEIEKCHVILLIMDGRVLDEGACFEVGYAFARGKICIGLKTDVRSLLPIGDNPMIECALKQIFTQPLEIVEWLNKRMFLQY